MSSGDNKELADTLIVSAYHEICESYRAIDDFRAKLLALLPIVSAGGIFLLLDNNLDLSLKYLIPIGIFGVVVTIGLFAYELHGIKKCDQLIKLGQHIETTKHIHGPFTKRPGRVELSPTKKKKGPYINEPVAARIIYPAVMAAWMYLAVFKCECLTAAVLPVITYFIGFFVPGVLNLEGEEVTDAIKHQNNQSVSSQL